VDTGVVSQEVNYRYLIKRATTWPRCWCQTTQTHTDIQEQRTCSLCHDAIRNLCM